MKRLLENVAIDDIAEPMAVELKGSLLTGVILYIVGLSALTAWEEFVVPRLKLNSILPDVPIYGNLRQRDIAEKWITPLTADLPIPPPTLQQLSELGKFKVGKRESVTQYITTNPLGRSITGVREVSDDWSKYYDSEIVIYKENLA